jgi:hypothetical protein
MCQRVERDDRVERGVWKIRVGDVCLHEPGARDLTPCALELYVREVDPENGEALG